MTEMTAAPESRADQRPLDWMKRSTIEGFAALIVGGGSGMGAAYSPAACSRASRCMASRNVSVMPAGTTNELIEKPPQQLIAWPVMNDAAGEARNTARSAISLG